jgi:hypothetical protein
MYLLKVVPPDPRRTVEDEKAQRVFNVCHQAPNASPVVTTKIFRSKNLMTGGQRGGAAGTTDPPTARVFSTAASGIVRPTLSKCSSRALRQFQLDWAKFVRDRNSNNADPSNPRISKVRQRDCLTPQLLEGLMSANVFESRDETGAVVLPLTTGEVTSLMVANWLRKELRGDIDHFNKSVYESRMSSVSCSPSEALRVVQLLVDYQNALADMSLQPLVETSTKTCVEEIVNKLRPLNFREHVNTVLQRQRDLKKNWTQFTRWLQAETKGYDKYQVINRSLPSPNPQTSRHQREHLNLSVSNGGPSRNLGIGFKKGRLKEKREQPQSIEKVSPL